MGLIQKALYLMGLILLVIANMSKMVSLIQQSRFNLRIIVD